MLASLPVSLYKYPLRGEALFEGGGGGVVKIPIKRWGSTIGGVGGGRFV